MAIVMSTPLTPLITPLLWAICIFLVVYVWDQFDLPAASSRLVGGFVCSFLLFAILISGGICAGLEPWSFWWLYYWCWR